MGNWALYFAFLIPPLILGFVVQGWLRKTVARNMQLAVASGLSGADVARQILDRNGLQGVPVDTSPGGPLSDHYDPRKRALFLSPPVYEPATVAAAAVAAHETGHAIGLADLAVDDHDEVMKNVHDAQDIATPILKQLNLYKGN